jgi:membrane protein
MGFPRSRLRELARAIVDAFAEHGLLTYASAISFRALVALVPLILLGVALLGALGLEDVWRESLAPPIQDRITPTVFAAVDSSVERILSTGTAGLIAFAAALLLWDMTWAVQAVMNALNRIHGVEEGRPWRRRLPLAIGLAAAVSLCLIGSVLVVTTGPRLAEGGVLDALLGGGRWLAAIVLLTLAVGLLVRYGPAERPEARWASAGSALVIGVWILASLAFRWWVGSVGDFESAIGTLAVFLLLTLYVFVSAMIFIVGVQLDEVLRKERRGS